MLARGVPIVASVGLHFSVFASVLGGHGASASARPALEVKALDLVEVQRDEEAVAPPPPIPSTEPNVLIPTHHHSYPLAPSHDAHPHDPALVHAPIAAMPAAV